MINFLSVFIHQDRRPSLEMTKADGQALDLSHGCNENKKANEVQGIGIRVIKIMNHGTQAYMKGKKMRIVNEYMEKLTSEGSHEIKEWSNGNNSQASRGGWYRKHYQKQKWVVGTLLGGTGTSL